jgi:hypothetical protein
MGIFKTKPYSTVMSDSVHSFPSELSITDAHLLLLSDWTFGKADDKSISISC